MKQANKNLLITGATGFVGSHLLAEVIESDDVGLIFVLSRSADEHQDFFKRLEKYSINIPNQYQDKVKLIKGDINQTHLGLSLDIYNQLSEIVDVIYHVAAEVNHVKTYAELKAANVDSVQDILSLAHAGKQKIINFVSTMAAASEKDADDLYVEEFVGDTPVNLTMGYLQTKYQAEYMLSQYKDKSLINVFRLGYISGNTHTGVSLCESNQLMLFIKSCIQMGFAPNIKRIINLTPVDFTASILGAEFFREHAGEVMHLVNCKEYITWTELITFINQEGFKVDLIDLKSWQELLKKAGRNNALYRMLLTYRREDADDHIIRFGKNIHEYRIDNVRSFCQAQNIVIPHIKYDYLKKVFNNLIQIGFFPQPHYKIGE